MDRKTRDLMRKYFLMEDINIKEMSLQQLFDHRYEYLNLREKVQKKFEELEKEKPE